MADKRHRKLLASNVLFFVARFADETPVALTLDLVNAFAMHTLDRTVRTD